MPSTAAHALCAPARTGDALDARALADLDSEARGARGSQSLLVPTPLFFLPCEKTAVAVALLCEASPPQALVPRQGGRHNQGKLLQYVFR